MSKKNPDFNEEDIGKNDLLKASSTNIIEEMKHDLSQQVLTVDTLPVLFDTKTTNEIKMIYHRKS